MTASIPDVEQAKLAAIQALRQELPQLLSTEESRQLEAKLAEVLSKADDPAELPQAIALAFDAIKRHPQAFQRLQEIARQARMAEGEVRFGGYGYHPPPGGILPIRPGPLMVCPVEPTHYRQYLRTAGQRLRCPLHEVDLVPCEQQAGP